MMIRKLISTIVATAALATATAPAAVSAHEHDGWHEGDRGGYGWQHDEGRRDGRYEGRRDWDHREHYDHDRYDRRGYGGRAYGYNGAYDVQPGYVQTYEVQQGYYAQPGYVYAQPGYASGYDQRAYYGRPQYRRSYCRNDGATGTILGAIAGGLIGNGVAGRGDRALGTVVGAGGGALAGRAIDRNC